MNSQITHTKSLRPKRRANSILIKANGVQSMEEMPPNCSYSRVSRVQTVDETKEGYKLFRKGDIVRITDSEDGNDYFAQISELIVDKFAQRFAMVVWLTPKIGILAQSTKEDFKPDEYEHSIAEQRPIPLSACEFECYCPKIRPYSSFTEWSLEALVRKKIRKELFDNINERN